MQKLVDTYTKLFQELQQAQDDQEIHFEILSNSLAEKIQLLKYQLNNPDRQVRPNSLSRLALTKMLSSLSTYKARCDNILKQLRSSKIDFAETMKTQKWVSEAIATKEKLNDSNTERIENRI